MVLQRPVHYFELQLLSAVIATVAEANIEFDFPKG
jgi:hypothetical protein